MSRTRSSPLRLVDVAGRCLTVRPPLRMRSRRDPSHAGRRGAAPIAGAREAAQRAAARTKCAAQEPHARTSGYDSVFKGRIEPDVHDRARGKAWGDRRDSNSFRSLHKRVPRPLRLRPPCRPGTNRTPVTRFGVAIAATTRTFETKRGPAARRSPRRAYRSFGAVTMRRSRSPDARRLAKRRDRRGNSNPRTAACGLCFEVGWMRTAAS